ncbi:lipase [Rhodococcus rhodnii]|uniref:Lipase n=1 Tax=Rhodococcus rhodnii TaxID=38312 RepID=A0A6P2C8G9_9NOCA|nr:lipase family protein [Rhodococcus rhodnii]TXG89034.1 lipase [Rhodococcus rhodnii]
MPARTRAARSVAAALAVALCTLGAAGTAQARPEPSTPQLPDVFDGYVVSTFQDGRFATPQEILDGLHPDTAFYDEPELTGGEAPGTLLKSMPVEVQFSGFRPGNLRAWRLMYVTTGLDARTPEISTGILLVPDDGRDDATRPLIGYQEANDSVGPTCHPSTQWTGANPMDGASWSALGPLAQMFGDGLAVMISDVGNDADPAPKGVFAGRFAGHANLDGMRAALTLDDAGLSRQTPVSIFGIAGGGVGAAFAAEAQPEYAPELDVRSTVLEGMVVDQRNFMRVSDGSVGSGFAFATLLGLEPKYPEMRVDEKLTPLGRQVADWYRTQCQTPAYFTAPFVPLSSFFTSGLAPADIPEFQHVYDDNLLGTRAPGADVLIASCGADDSPMSLVPAQDARDLADRYRAGGTDVTYAPTDCSMTRFVTDMYGWGTDLFGMQTVDWMVATLRE